MDNKIKLIEITFAKAERPELIETMVGGRVNFGQNNNYPSYLNDLFYESPKHGAIVKGKANYIFGKGFEGGEMKVNDYGETLNDVLRRAVLDDEKFGGYALQIVWSKAGTVSSIYHIKFHKVRTNQDNTKFWVKDEWDFNKQISRKDRKKEREYKGLDLNNRTGTQIFYYKQDGDQNDVYPMPPYYSSINYIEADRLLSQHILGMAKGGFVASKLINFNGVNPTPEEKQKIESAIEKKFTGPDGKQFMLAFNANAENAVTVADLGASQLTKEDFTNVNNLIQQEIFAGHQITSPTLFGIKTEGQLGGRTELRDAYEIFNNTYVSNRQKVHEENFNFLLSLMGISSMSIIPVEPLGFEFSEAVMAANMTRNEIRDKMGLPPEVQAPTAPTDVNDALRNLTGRQMQNIMRVVRQYGQGKITRPMAVTMLQSGYGLTDTDIMNFLGEDEQQFSAEGLDLLLAQFKSVGEAKQNFVKVKAFTMDAEKQAFAEVEGIGQLEADIINLISKDERITPEVLADVLQQDVDVIKQVLGELEKGGYIKTGAEKIGVIKKPPVKPTTTRVMIRYSYEGPKDDRNRDFCRRMLDLDRYYSRADIERISERVGYSVWDSRGGWLTLPDGSHQPFCRHRWEAHIVLRKQ